jgi:hypothetical protein
MLAAMREEMRIAKDERDFGSAAAILDDFVRSGLLARRTLAEEAARGVGREDGPGSIPLHRSP